jgi:hypothetical protein
MFKKAAVLTIILIASVSMSHAKGATHHNVSQTTIVNTTATNFNDNTSNSGDPGNTGGSTLVTADIRNSIKRAGDITSIVSGGRNNQANAASVVITDNSDVSGSLMNKVNTSGDLTAIVEGGRNNIANAGTVSVRGAVVSGAVANEVKNTGDITSTVSKGRNNQANAASIAIN